VTERTGGPGADAAGAGYTLRSIFARVPCGTVDLTAMCGKKNAHRRPAPPFPFPKRVTPERDTGLFSTYERFDHEVIETMQRDARNEPQQTLYALLAGAEGCGSAARSARLAQDDELADFLCRAQDGIVGEAERLLAKRVAA
jgi:hypothetical protein